MDQQEQSPARPGVSHSTLTARGPLTIRRLGRTPVPQCAQPSPSTDRDAPTPCHRRPRRPRLTVNSGARTCPPLPATFLFLRILRPGDAEAGDERLPFPGRPCRHQASGGSSETLSKTLSISENATIPRRARRSCLVCLEASLGGQVGQRAPQRAERNTAVMWGGWQSFEDKLWGPDQTHGDHWHCPVVTAKSPRMTNGTVRSI